MPGDLAKVARYRQTTLNAIDHLSCSPDNFGVGDDVEVARPFDFLSFLVGVGKRLDDGDAQRHLDLGSGETNAAGRSHRLNHVVHESLKLAVKRCHGARLLAQDWIVRLDYLSNCHTPVTYASGSSGSGVLRGSRFCSMACL